MDQQGWLGPLGLEADKLQNFLVPSVEGLGTRWILRGRCPAGPPPLMEENYLEVESEASKSCGGPTFLVEKEH